jgi:hypothetical protein
MQLRKLADGALAQRRQLMMGDLGRLLSRVVKEKIFFLDEQNKSFPTVLFQALSLFLPLSFSLVPGILGHFY